MHHHSQPRATRDVARPVVGVLAIGLMLALSLAATPATADSSSPIDENYNLGVEADDTRSIGRCNFHVEKVNEENGTVKGRLAAAVRPKNLAVALGNSHVSLTCDLFSPAGLHLASLHIEDNKPSILTHTRAVVVPIFDGYQLCGAMTTTTGSGNIFDAVACADSF